VKREINDVPSHRQTIKPIRAKEPKALFSYCSNIRLLTRKNGRIGSPIGYQQAAPVIVVAPGSRSFLGCWPRPDALPFNVAAPVPRRSRHNARSPENVPASGERSNPSAENYL
jgi:hypothetical protein